MAPNDKVDRMMRAAASLLGLPEETRDALRWPDSQSFRRNCVAFMLAELGVDRTEIAIAIGRSTPWLEKALKEVRQRVSASPAFRMNMTSLIDDLRLASPATSRFRQIRKVIAGQGLAAPDAVSTVAALITLADALIGDEKS